MKKRQESLRLTDKVAIMLAAALPIATFAAIAIDSKEIGSDVEI